MGDRADHLTAVLRPSRAAYATRCGQGAVRPLKILVSRPNLRRQDRHRPHTPEGHRIAARSAALSSQAAALALACTCSGPVAPAMTDVTPSWAASQAMASSRTV